MSVPKGKRSTSALQFYITAIDLRRELTLFLLRDFGIKDKVRTVENYARMKHMSEQDTGDFLNIVHKYNMSCSDANIITELISKYQMSLEDRLRFEQLVVAYNMNETAIDEFPKWYVERERNRLAYFAEQLHSNIVVAYSIYPTNMTEFDERRLYQDKAIANCFQLLQELQYLMRILPIDANKLMHFTDLVKQETALLKGWRKSDNKIKAKL